MQPREADADSDGVEPGHPGMGADDYAVSDGHTQKGHRVGAEPVEFVDAVQFVPAQGQFAHVPRQRRVLEKLIVGRDTEASILVVQQLQVLVKTEPQRALADLVKEPLLVSLAQE